MAESKPLSKVQRQRKNKWKRPKLLKTCEKEITVLVDKPHGHDQSEINSRHGQRQMTCSVGSQQGQSVSPLGVSSSDICIVQQPIKSLEFIENERKVNTLRHTQAMLPHPLTAPSKQSTPHGTSQHEPECDSFLVVQPHESGHEEVKSKLESIECQMFRAHFDQLLNAVTDPDMLAAKLYTKHVISLDTLKEIKAEDAHTKTLTLLLTVQEQISFSPTTKLREFVDVLNSDPSLQHLACKLDPSMEKSANYCSSDLSEMATFGTPVECCVFTDSTSSNSMAEQRPPRKARRQRKGHREHPQAELLPPEKCENEASVVQTLASLSSDVHGPQNQRSVAKTTSEHDKKNPTEQNTHLHSEPQPVPPHSQSKRKQRKRKKKKGKVAVETSSIQSSLHHQTQHRKGGHKCGGGRYDTSGRGQYDESRNGRYDKSGRHQYDESGKSWYDSGRGRYDDSGRGQYESGRDQYESERGWYKRGQSRSGWCDKGERGWYNKGGRGLYERDWFDESGRSWYERDWYERDWYDVSKRELYERLPPHLCYRQTLATLHPSFPIEFGMHDGTVAELVQVHQQRSKQERQVSTGKIDSLTGHSSSLNEATTKDDSHGHHGNSEHTPYSSAYPSLILPEFQSGSSESTTSSTPSSSAAEYQGTTRLTERDHSTLCEYLNKHAAHWRTIGQYLGFLPGELDIIKHDLSLAMGGPVAYLTEMLAKWLQWAPGDGRRSKDFATLEALKHTLNQAGFGVTATELTNSLSLNPISNSSQASFSSESSSEHQEQVVNIQQSRATAIQSVSKTMQVEPPNLSAYDRYANYLRDYYTQSRRSDDKWPHLGVRKYIRLAVISNKFKSRKDLNRFRKATIHGSIDDILDTKAPLELHEMFYPNDFQTNREHNFKDGKICYEIYAIRKVLIEGAPGIGKSTMSWEICERWGRGELFTYFSIVLLLKFRDKWVQDAKCLSDLFRVHYRNPELQQSITDEIMSTGGNRLLLILEGYDEAPASLQTTSSIFVDLFTGKLLPNATVVITTRPSASSELRLLCEGYNSRRIEVLGFGVKEINEYIHSSFTEHVELLPDFKQYLDLYPHIHSMMYVPLNSAIVTHVYQDCKSTSSIVPKTMTQLYSSLVKTLLLRYLKEQPEYKSVKIRDFTDLPKPVYDQFLRLCEIAYSGITKAQTELIFSDLPSDFNTLGLMQSCPELYIDEGESVSYNFLHLTIQEFLAAYHISLFDEDNFPKEIEKLLGIGRPVVLQCLAGLCQAKEIFWKAIPKFLPAFSDNCVSLYILHLLFEAQDLSAYTILGYGELCFLTQNSMKPFDFYVLGSCIANSANTCKWEVDFSNCAKIDYNYALFAKGLIARTSHIQCHIEQTICLRHITDSGLHSFSSALGSTLTFECLKITTKAIGSVVLGLSLLLQQSFSLEHLSLDGSKIQNSGAAEFAKMLQANRTLKHLDLHNNRIQTEGVVCLAEALKSNSSVEFLRLSCNEIQVEGAICLAKVLETNSTIAHLDLSDNAIRTEGAIHLAKALETNSTIEHLDLSDNILQSEVAIHLANALEMNSTLQHLDLSRNTIYNEGTSHLAKALLSNSTLKYLGIRRVIIDDKGCQSIAAMLRCNQSLETLDLSNNFGFSRDCVIKLIASLNLNTTLKTLRLPSKYEYYDFVQSEISNTRKSWLSCPSLILNIEKL